MSNIHVKLFEAAKLDSESVKVLNDNNLYAPAIYHCSQAIEKLSKSIHAYYMINCQNKNENDIRRVLKNGYSHGLRESTRGITDYLMRLDTEIEIKNNPKLKEKENEAYESLKTGCDALVKDLLGTDEIIVGFNTLADKMYNLFKNYDIDIFHSTSPAPEILKRWLNDPDKRFYRYIFSAMLLSTLLAELEKYSRYPMLEFSNNNITILNSPQNKFAIGRIHEIIREMVELVPVVWKQVDSYKTSLQN